MNTQDITHTHTHTHTHLGSRDALWFPVLSLRSGSSSGALFRLLHRLLRLVAEAAERQKNKNIRKC